MVDAAVETFVSELLRHQEDLLAEWRPKVRALESAQRLDTPTLNDHIPGIFVSIAQAFRHTDVEGDEYLKANSTAHGMQRRWVGYDIVEVVAEYSVMRSVLHNFVASTMGSLVPAIVGTIDSVIDEAIALAVRSYVAEQLTEQNRYRAERAAFVTHDLKTPLAAIHTGFVLLQSQPTPQMLDSILPMVQRNIQRLDALISKVVEQEKAPDISPNIESREVDLWPIVQGLINDLGPLAQASSITISNSIDHNIVVFADALLVNQIFQNLISNAIKYTPRGHIEVGALLLANGCIQCWVTDDGAGIPPGRLSTVFDKYETDGAGGSGLGLAIVRQAVEAHGGRITVESQEGQGSAFRFVLPGTECKTLPGTRSVPESAGSEL